MPACSNPVREAERRRKLSVALKGKPNPKSGEARVGKPGSHKPRPSIRGEGNPMTRPEVAAKNHAGRKGKSLPKGSEGQKAYYQTKAGLLKRQKLSFFRMGHRYGSWEVPWCKLLWRKLLWKLGFGRRI